MVWHTTYSKLWEENAIQRLQLGIIYQERFKKAVKALQSTSNVDNERARKEKSAANRTMPSRDKAIMKIVDSRHDYLLKILLVGDCAVGKTSLLMTFTEGQYNANSRATIGVDLKVKMVNVRGKKVKLTIWDTAGQERFRTLTSAYYRGAHAAILVYDITRRSTFENIREWLKEVDIFTTKEDVVKVLIGNKLDLQSARKVNRSEGSDFARDYGMLFFEASARTSLGVQDAFIELVEKILDQPSLVEDQQRVASTAWEVNFNDDSETKPCYCNLL